MDDDLASDLVGNQHMKNPTTVQLEIENKIAFIWFDGETNRNALSLSTMRELESMLMELEQDRNISVILLRGRGPSFCAGFDLAPVLEDSSILNDFIGVLGRLLKIIRRHRAVVIAGVDGAAVAGGCAIVSACDMVVVSPDSRLGYPVHALGISPVVSGNTLASSIGNGPARSLLLSGKLIDGIQAFRTGLASMVDEAPCDASEKLARRVATHGSHALEVTKSWLNELDDSRSDERFDAPVEASAPLANDEESMELLKRRWGRR
ncbi:MAG: hypothetical protein CMJ40_07890 [Phycisphaerae bacterium]|nr:hypothetical protein [Phycisphaerae bacterium]